MCTQSSIFICFHKLLQLSYFYNMIRIKISLPLPAVMFEVNINMSTLSVQNPWFQNCQYSSCSSSSYSSSKIIAKSSQPPQNLCRPLKTFVCVSLRYRKHQGVAIVVVVCGKICGKMCGKMCDKMCG